MSQIGDWPDVMFPDLADLVSARGTPTRDPSGGRVDNAIVLASGVACSYQPVTAADLPALAANDADVQSFVYFPLATPALRQNDTIRLTVRNGDALSPPAALRVKSLVRQGFPTCEIWRADCTNTA